MTTTMWGVSLALLASVSTEQQKGELTKPCPEETVSQIARWDEERLVRELPRWLHPESADDIDCARFVLKAVRTRRVHAARPDLEKLLQETTPSRSRYVKTIDLRRSMLYEAEATLLSFDLDEHGLDSVTERATHLFGVIENKLKDGHAVINAEFILLQDDATHLTELLLKILDSSPNEDIRAVAVDVARSSTDPRVEREILARLDQAYLNQRTLFLRMGGLLGVIGGEPSVRYLVECLNRGDADARTAAVGSLSQLARRGRDEQVRVAARAALLDVEGKQASQPDEAGGLRMPQDGVRAPARGPEPQEGRFMRPEEIGEDLSSQSSAELITVLLRAGDPIARRKAARTLGDRAIAGALELSEAETNALGDVVRECVEMCRSDDPNVRSEGWIVVQYLWRLAVPSLLEQLDNESTCTAENAARLLGVMQDEAIVRAVVERVGKPDDDHGRRFAIVVLRSLQHRSRPLVSGRTPLDDEQAKSLYETVIAPALREVEKK